MNKNDLRKKYKLIRSNISNKENKNKIIFDNIIKNEQIKKCKVIMTYISFNDEVDTLNLINYFLDKKIIAVPKVNKDYMDFYIINSLKDLKKGTFGILEPTSNNKLNNFDNSVCIIPGICFDKKGNRIGYGKGYYDKYLKDKNIYKIGLCFKECLVNKIDSDTHDIKIDEIISSK